MIGWDLVRFPDPPLLSGQSGNLISDKEGQTVPEKAVWNCVAKQPPEENPLTAIVSGLIES